MFLKYLGKVLVISNDVGSNWEIFSNMYFKKDYNLLRSYIWKVLF